MNTRNPRRDDDKKPGRTRNTSAGPNNYKNRTSSSSGSTRKPRLSESPDKKEGFEKRPYNKSGSSFSNDRRKPEEKKFRSFDDAGSRPPRDFGDRKPYTKRTEGGEGGYGSRTPRDGGSKRPYTKRTEGSEGGYNSRPPRDFGDRKPYTKRTEGGEGGYGSRTPRDGENKRPYTKRTEGGEGGYGSRTSRDGENKRPYTKRTEGGEGGYGSRPPRDFGDRKPYTKRTEGGEGGYGSRTPRDGGSKRPYTKRTEGGEGGYGSRTPRDFGDKKPYAKRTSFSEHEGEEGGQKTHYRPTYNNDNKRPYKARTGSSYKKPTIRHESDQEGIRLNRYLSNAGICSRREADDLIASGVVSVNGTVVTELGTRVDPDRDIVKYNGESVRKERLVYVLLNKPKDYITTTDDPQERRTVLNLVEKITPIRVYPVGRLDRNTTGVLLLTNDGELTNRLTHPKFGITKMYAVELDKKLRQEDFLKIQEGVELEDGPIKVDQVAYIEGMDKKNIGVQLHSGRNRIVRRIFEHLGYKVVKLDRTAFGTLSKKGMKRSECRFLTPLEVGRLKKLAGMAKA